MIICNHAMTAVTTTTTTRMVVVVVVVAVKIKITILSGIQMPLYVNV
jgi:hypothetical protein